MNETCNIGSLIGQLSPVGGLDGKLSIPNSWFVTATDEEIRKMLDEIFNQ